MFSPPISLYIFALCFVVNDVNDDHDNGFIEVHNPEAFFIPADNCDNNNLLFIFDNNNCDNPNWNDDDALTVVRDSTSYTFVADGDDDDAFKIVLDSTS